MKYFLTLVDDFSRYILVIMLKSKAQVYTALEVFLKMIETQFGTILKTIRSDNGSEFVNNKCAALFQGKVIVHQTTCIHTPQ